MTNRSGKWANQASRHERGYGSAWDKLRKIVLRRDGYLCVNCAKNDRPTPATDVDHITPKAKGGVDDLDNLQSLCRACHDDKSARDRGVKVTGGFDADARPIW